MNKMYEHLSDIKHNRDTTVARHFNQLGTITNPPLEVIGLQFIHSHPDSDRAASSRNELEEVWMVRLNSFIPHGLNLQEARTYGH